MSKKTTNKREQDSNSFEVMPSERRLFKIFNPQDWLNADKSVVSPKQNTSTQSQSPSLGGVGEVEEITQRIEAAAADIAPNYADWRDLGFALADALGESGRSYYHRLSRFYSGYTESETDRQFSACLAAHGHGVTVKTLFHLAKQAGISVAIPKETQPKSTGETFKTSKTSNEVIEDIEVLSDTMPTFSQDVTGGLPSLLSQIAAKALSPEDADLLLLGSLTVFSACLPNVYGIYGGREVFPNLFLFVTAQASAGKGRLTLCRHLVEPIHRQLRDIYAAEIEEYRRKQAEYVANKKNPDAEPPQEPPLRTLFIPANSSATSVYQVLNDNKGVGLMFETEGDTLASTFKSDYGNFSDGFRKAFHHETISYNRRKDREFVELAKPRLSALLSGTPRQIQSLIPDAENGLFSRFIFYYMNVRLEWLDVFADSENGTLDYHFQQFGNQFYDLYKILQSSEPIRFSFSQPQQTEFNACFAEVQSQYSALFGLDIVASVRRLGLITYRTAMILSALRIIDGGTISALMVCEDTDFQTALAIVKVLLRHTAKVFEQLPQAEQPTGREKTQVKQQFFDTLPPRFDKQKALATAQTLGISASTAERQLQKWCVCGKLCHPKHGEYSKPK